jgi:DNA-binding NtrC family response regulator
MSMSVGRRTLLIIDDEEQLQEALADFFEMVEVSTFSALDGATGLELFQIHQAQLDLVLLDLTMPGLDGIEILQKLRQINTTMPVILSSGYAKYDIQIHLAQDPHTYFLAKPYIPHELLEIMEKALA